MTKDWNGRSGYIHTGSTRWDSSWPEYAGERDRAYLFSYMEKRFGIPLSVFEGYLLFRKSKSWWIMVSSPMITTASDYKVWRVGMKAFQKVGGFIKPTTGLIQLLGHRASRAVINISKTELKRLLDGERIPSSVELDNGYVILYLKGKALGLGLLIKGMVRSQMPKKEANLLSII